MLEIFLLAVGVLFILVYIFRALVALVFGPPELDENCSQIDIDVQLAEEKARRDSKRSSSWSR